MNKIKLISAIWALTCIWTTNADAKAELLPVSSFEEMEKVAMDLNKQHAGEMLIVMDDDDTLTMMTCKDQKSPEHCQYLGGPAWYSWQSDMIDKKLPQHFMVANSQDELLRLAALLLAMNDMPFTEKSIPDVLNKLTKQGAKLLVLTARGTSNMSATESQFNSLAAFPEQQGSFLTSIRDNALIGKKSGIASIAGPITPSSCNATRPIAYQQGVMYVAGQNKGEMLKCLLERTNSGKIKNIVFIDDTLDNAEDVFTSFELSKKYNVKSLHYTLLSKHKLALTKELKGQKENKYQKMAHERWTNINKVLSNQLIQPATKLHTK